MKIIFKDLLIQLFADYIEENDYNWRILRLNSVIDIICLESLSFQNNKQSDQKLNLLFCLFIVYLVNSEMGVKVLSKDSQKLFTDKEKIQEFIEKLISKHSSEIRNKESKSYSKLNKELNYLKVAKSISLNNEDSKEIILELFDIVLFIKYSEFITT